MDFIDAHFKKRFNPLLWITRAAIDSFDSFVCMHRKAIKRYKNCMEVDSHVLPFALAPFPFGSHQNKISKGNLCEQRMTVARKHECARAQTDSNAKNGDNKRNENSRFKCSVHTLIELKHFALEN